MKERFSTVIMKNCIITDKINISNKKNDLKSTDKSIDAGCLRPLPPSKNKRFRCAGGNSLLPSGCDVSNRILLNLRETPILLLFIFLILLFSGCTGEKPSDSGTIPASSSIPSSSSSSSSPAQSSPSLNVDDLSIFSSETKGNPGKFKPAYLSDLDKKNLKEMGEKIGKNPGSVEPLLERGDFYLHRFYMDEASKDLAAAEKISADNPGVLLLKANLLLVQGDLKQAFETCKGVLKSHPDNADAYRIMAEILMADRQSSRSMEYMKRATELDPGNYRNFLLMAHFSVMTGRIPDAIVNLDKAVEKAPGVPEVYVARGLFRADMKQIEKALEDLNKSLELDPGLMHVYLAKGRILERNGKKEEALKVFREVLNRFKDLDKRRAKLLRYKIRKLEQTMKKRT